MSVLSSYQIHEKMLFGQNANGVSRPAFVQDFKTLQFTVFYPPLSFSFNTLVGVFVVGETVTGGTSGATGVVGAVQGSAMLLTGVVGTFVSGETVTGGTSGATAVISAPPIVANFKIGVYKSNQELPPDVTIPSGFLNQYSQVGYTDESDQVYYPAGTSYDFTASTTDTPTFNIESTGSRWVWVYMFDHVTGGLISVELMAFSNFN